MIQAQSADGVLHEFPDETDPAVMDFAMRRYAINNPPSGPMSTPPDEHFTDTPPGKILDAFGQGASQDWGAGTVAPVSKETVDALNGIGIDHQAWTTKEGRAFGEAVLRRSAAALQRLAEGGLAKLLGMPAFLEQFQAAGEKEPQYKPGMSLGQLLPKDILENPAVLAFGVGNIGQVGRGFLERLIGRPPPSIDEAAGLRVIPPKEGSVVLPEVTVRPPELEPPPTAPGTPAGKGGPVLEPRPAGETPLTHVDENGTVRTETLTSPDAVKAAIQEAAPLTRNLHLDPELVRSDIADAAGVPINELGRDLGTVPELNARLDILYKSTEDLQAAASKVAANPADEAAVAAFEAAAKKHGMITDTIIGKAEAPTPAAPTAEAQAKAAAQTQAANAAASAATAAKMGIPPRPPRRGAAPPPPGAVAPPGAPPGAAPPGRAAPGAPPLPPGTAPLVTGLTHPAQVNKFMGGRTVANWKDKLVEAWINALLSRPVTHLKNIVGNTAVAVNSIVETAGAAAVGGVRRAIGLAGAERVRAGEIGARFEGMVHGAHEGTIAFGKAVMDENFVPQGLRTVQQSHAIGGVVGRAIRLPGRFLAAEDALFQAVAKRQELAALAYRDAASAGLTGNAKANHITNLLNNPTAAMLEQADKFVEYQTFVKPLGATGQALQAFSNRYVLAKVVFPFIRTPLNLVKYAGERTPLGVLSKEVRANLAGRNGAVAQDTQIARMILGTTVATSVAAFAASDHITGGGPTDANEQARKRLTGWRPYSIRIGDMYYSYNWLDPMSLVMETTADLVDAAKRGFGGEDLEKVGASLVMSTGRNILGSLSLRGASDLVKAVTDPTRFGPGYIRQLVGSVVPSVVGGTATGGDPVMREARTVLDAVRARLPGAREGLAPVRDLWGEPIRTTEAGGGALGGLFNPVVVSQYRADPVNAKLEQLGMSPGPVDRTIQGVTLTAQQHDDYARVAGRLAKMRLDDYVNRPGFSKMNDMAQREVITAIIAGAREQARGMVMKQNPEIMKSAIAEKRAEITGAKPVRPIPQVQPQ